MSLFEQLPLSTGTPFLDSVHCGIEYRHRVELMCSHVFLCFSVHGHGLLLILKTSKGTMAIKSAQIFSPARKLSGPTTPRCQKAFKNRNWEEFCPD